jgi:hypothetical protein
MAGPASSSGSSGSFKMVIVVTRLLKWVTDHLQQ